MEITCDIAGKPLQQFRNSAERATRGRRPQHPQLSLPRSQPHSDRERAGTSRFRPAMLSADNQ